MHHPRPSERQFGVSVGLVTLAIGIVTWWRGHATAAAVLGSVGAVLVAAGLLAPAALRGANRAWWAMAQVLGWVNARILLTLFFVLVITPVGAVMRLLGRNPLKGRAAGTNWLPSASRRRDPKHYEHLF